MTTAVARTTAPARRPPSQPGRSPLAIFALWRPNFRSRRCRRRVTRSAKRTGTNADRPRQMVGTQAARALPRDDPRSAAPRNGRPATRPRSLPAPHDDGRRRHAPPQGREHPGDGTCSGACRLPIANATSSRVRRRKRRSSSVVCPRRRRTDSSARVFLSLSYDERLDYCDRPEQIDGPSPESWAVINAHLGTHASSLAELVAELGRRRFGHVPRVGDSFCGGGSIPFEAARLGCEAYGSDLNPVAAMLTWASLNIVGGGEDVAEEVAARAARGL